MSGGCGQTVVYCDGSAEWPATVLRRHEHGGRDLIVSVVWGTGGLATVQQVVKYGVPPSTQGTPRDGEDPDYFEADTWRPV